MINYSDILERSDLNDSEKLLLFQIKMLDNSDRGCYARNSYLGDRLAWTLSKVKRVLQGLKENDFVTLDNPGAIDRHIFINETRLKNETRPKSEPGPNLSLTRPKSEPVVAQICDRPGSNLSHIIRIDKNIKEVNKNNPIVPLELFEVEVKPETDPAPKAKRVKLEIQDEQFERAWIMFERYGSKKKALAYWQKLNQGDRDEIEEKIPDYVASTPGCEFRKMFEGWINPENRLWERPIVKRKSNGPDFRPEAQLQRIKSDMQRFDQNKEFYLKSSSERDDDFMRAIGMDI